MEHCHQMIKEKECVQKKKIPHILKSSENIT